MLHFLFLHNSPLGVIDHKLIPAIGAAAVLVRHKVCAAARTLLLLKDRLSFGFQTLRVSGAVQLQLKLFIFAGDEPLIGKEQLVQHRLHCDGGVLVGVLNAASRRILSTL